MRPYRGTWSPTCVLLAYALSALVEPQPLQQCASLSELSVQHERPVQSVKHAVTVLGQPRNVTIYWNGEPSRILSQLLLLLVRDVFGYTGITLRPGPRSLCDLHPPENELAVVLSAMLPEPISCDLASLGLVVLRNAAAPLDIRLHALLSKAARNNANCTIASTYMFCRNERALRDCGFLQHDDEVSALSARVPHFTPDEEEHALRALHQLGVRLRIEKVSRVNLTRLVLSGERSFLFVDYELWSDLGGVHLVWLPSAQRDTSTAAVFAANEMLRTFAPPFYDVMMNLSATSEELRELLEARELRDRWGEALCERAKAQAIRLPQKRHDYRITVLVCEDDPDRNSYGKIGREVGSLIWDITQSRGYGIAITSFPIDCSKRYAANIRLTKIRSSSQFYRHAGVVLPAEGAELVTEFASKMYLPLVVYGVPADAVPGAGAPVGVAAHLARALREFIARHGWNRLAVVSEQSASAKALMDALCAPTESRSPNQLLLHEKQLELGANVSETLRTLVVKRSRIFLVNGGWRTARLVLAMAAQMQLTADRGYAWVALEWRGAAPPAGMRLFTISFQCNATASFADAALSLGAAFTELVQHAPQYRDDLRRPEAYSEFWRRFDSINETGVCQHSLRYRNGALDTPLIFLTELNGNTSRRLDTWTAHANRLEPLALLAPAPDPYEGGHAPHDGSVPCFWPRGDKFSPECMDRTVIGWALTFTVVAVAVSIATWVFKRRADRRRALSLLSEECQKRAQRERIVATLIDKLVDRDALELREEIGSGRFGRVRLAVLRAPGRRTRALAAKALHEDAAPAEESEFLREACTLATLEHEHVVRLVGICATGGPPLVLMEHAFFGDLLRYLRARRHLVEGGAEPAEAEAAEAKHVSAGELTRLAREAAAALGYLAHRGLVHRDVRAANCLVDARRTLKLGDFGMARETCPRGAEGEAEYACQRRGMFPVLWMAPESLSRGAFSVASDVWSFGVLAFEVITLGERPYGAWPPPRVLHHVLAGGRPRLPAEATAQARGFLLACWRHRTSERPTAAELVAYLAEHPRVLAPALTPLDELGSVDSGFCESGGPDRAGD